MAQSGTQNTHSHPFESNEGEPHVQNGADPDARIVSTAREFIRVLEERGSFNLVAENAVPSQDDVNRLIRLARCILFPGYFACRGLPVNRLEYHVQRKYIELHECAISLITEALCHSRHQDGKPCSDYREQAKQLALSFIERLAHIKPILDSDVQAAFLGDPSAKSREEVILSYPGLFALTVYRLAHELERLSIPLIPRMMTEYAHSITGIDIHPGARIGKSFFIDHGTGVVIGETTDIGDRVRLYQGVTLGALSLPRDARARYRNTKRHPTIEDDVIIYANTTILGGNTVIGARSIIGGNNWITESVPPDTKVVLKRPELTFINQQDKSDTP